MEQSILGYIKRFCVKPPYADLGGFHVDDVANFTKREEIILTTPNNVLKLNLTNHIVHIKCVKTDVFPCDFSVSLSDGLDGCSAIQLNGGSEGVVLLNWLIPEIDKNINIFSIPMDVVYTIHITTYDFEFEVMFNILCEEQSFGGLKYHDAYISCGDINLFNNVNDLAKCYYRMALRANISSKDCQTINSCIRNALKIYIVEEMERRGDKFFDSFRSMLYDNKIANKHALSRFRLVGNEILLSF